MRIIIFTILALCQNIVVDSNGTSDAEVRVGIQPNGLPTDEWIDAVRDRNSPVELEKIGTTRRLLSNEEKKWLNLLNSKISYWSSVKSDLHIPFNNLGIPETITLLVGNQGGDDGFTFLDRTICVDLAACVRTYGAEDVKGNEERLIRLLNHEYTHLLHREWLKKNPAEIKTPLDRALFACLFEGLGNYRSLSAKWINKDGSLTEQAQSTLNELQPIFVQRISALRSADSTEEEILTRGLSRGPFNKKWGALCTALWLAQEAKGNDLNLATWVQYGPNGILILARKYLPDNLRAKFMN